MKTLTYLVAVELPDNMPDYDIHVEALARVDPETEVKLRIEQQCLVGEDFQRWIEKELC